MKCNHKWYKKMRHQLKSWVNTFDQLQSQGIKWESC